MMKKVAVTGAGGYIGSITTRLLLQEGYTLVALDNFSRGYREPLLKLQEEFSSQQLIVEEVDVKDSGALSTLFKKYHEIQAVMHFAALLNVGESMNMPVEYFTNNVVGTQLLLQETIQAGIPYFIFSGSCTVYGNARYIPIDEKHPIQKPESVYGASKKICEELLEWYSNLEKLRYVALRYFNVCGATDDGEYGDSKRPSFHLVQNAVRGALGLEQFEFNYASVNTPDGSPVRDYVNVVDLAQAHVNAFSFLLKEKRSEIFNIGTGTGNSVLEIVNTVKKITGKDFETKAAQERRTGEADKMVADYTKAKKLLDWEPRHTLAESVQSLVKWYQKYPHGWSS